MKTYARLHEGRVVELFSTDADIRQLFHASLLWFDVTAQPSLRVGWTYDGKVFAAPTVVHSPPVAGVTLAGLQRQLLLLSQQIEALTNH